MGDLLEFWTSGYFKATVKPLYLRIYMNKLKWMELKSYLYGSVAGSQSD